MSDEGGAGGAPPPVTPEDPLIGQTVGSYKIVRELGRGGMGAVYVAEHTLLGKQAAVKVLLPRFSKERDMVNRFFGEAKAAATIKHEGIAEVFDFGYLPDGSGFIVMEFLEGESLTVRLQREGCLPLPLIVGIAKQVCAAVGAAHAQQIVHRDLKPDNVYLVPDEAMPNKLRVKVLDFGIAKLADEGQADEVKTKAGEMLGTPWYMSPEQCKGAGEVDARADVYSLGCIIYEMATGTVPFDEKGTGALIAAHIYENPPPPRTIDASLAPALEALILKALAKEPGERQQTMAVLSDELAACLLATENAASGEKGAQAKDAPGGPVPKPTPQPAGPAPTPAPVRVAPAARSKAPMIYGAVGLGLVAVVGGIWLAGRGRQEKTAGVTPAVVDAAPPPAVDAEPPPPATCDEGSPADCIARAEAETEPARKGTLYRKACEGGAGETCVKAGIYLRASEAPAAFALFKQGCDGGDLPACVELGLAYQRGTGIERDLTRAFAVFLEACDRKHADACARLALMYEEGRGVATDTSKAVALWTRACDAGSAFGCTGLGALVVIGQGVEQDTVKARGLYEQACAAGDAPGCMSLMIALRIGIGGDFDADGAAKAGAKATSLTAAACATADAEACGVAGLLAALAQDRATALSLLRRSCELGDASACGAAGFALSASGDAEAALKAYQNGCDGGDDGACVGLGKLALPDDPERAFDLFERACKRGGGDEGCGELASLYDQGLGVTKDPNRATALYRKGCESGSDDDCIELAKRLEQGIGGRRDERKARAAAERACRQMTPSCTLAARYAATGVGAPADLELAKTLYAKACAADVVEACPLAQDPLPAPDAGVTVEAPAPDGG